MNDKWNFLLSEFRRLGGIADNVCQREGKYGRGIFPVNTSLPSRILTPPQLLYKKDDIYLEDNQLRIKKNKKYSKEVIDFLIFIKITFHGDLEVKKQQNFLRKD